MENLRVAQRQRGKISREAVTTGAEEEKEEGGGSLVHFLFSQTQW